jgi:hypothetical protein
MTKIICTLHQTLLRCSNKRGYDGHTWRRKAIYKFQEKKLRVDQFQHTHRKIILKCTLKIILAVKFTICPVYSVKFKTTSSTHVKD